MRVHGGKEEGGERGGGREKKETEKCKSIPCWAKKNEESKKANSIMIRRERTASSADVDPARRRDEN